jgi:hypothetical protein
METSIMKTYRGSGIWQFKVVEARSDGEINEEATDNITEEAAEEIIEEVNDDVSFELVDDVDYEGNAEVIESPVRSRRNRKERQATRRSLDYHKEIRKGR